MPDHMAIIADYSNDTKFIPTRERWEEFYRRWCKPLAKSLYKHGSCRDCEEAVHMAFLKVMELSADLKLAKELAPKTESQWYAFMWWQARGVLSNIHRKAERFEPLTDGMVETLACRPDVDCIDAKIARRAICAAAWNACRTWRSPKAKYTAAMMFLLDGYSAEEVVKAVPEVLTANNLYQICRRVRRAIAEAARRPGSVLAELCND